LQEQVRVLHEKQHNDAVISQQQEKSKCKTEAKEAKYRSQIAELQHTVRLLTSSTANSVTEALTATVSATICNEWDATTSDATIATSLLTCTMEPVEARACDNDTKPPTPNITNITPPTCSSKVSVFHSG
jgi:hypothetical protein